MNYSLLRKLHPVIYYYCRNLPRWIIHYSGNYTQAFTIIPETRPRSIFHNSGNCTRGFIHYSKICTDDKFINLSWFTHLSTCWQTMCWQSLPKLVPTHLLYHNHLCFQVSPSFAISEPPSFPITQADLLICIDFDQSDCWHESVVSCSQWADVTTLVIYPHVQNMLVKRQQRPF